jgi:hypothetical protein
MDEFWFIPLVFAFFGVQLERWRLGQKTGVENSIAGYAKTRQLARECCSIYRKRLIFI